MPNSTAGPTLDATAARQCPVRTQLRIAPPAGVSPAPRSEADEHRVQALRDMVEQALTGLKDLPGAVDAEGNATRTAAAVGKDGGEPPASIVLHPWLSTLNASLDHSGVVTQRLGTPEGLVRVSDGYLPLLVKPHAVTELARTARARGMRASAPSDLPLLTDPADLATIKVAPGKRGRPDRTRTDGLELAHHWRRLQELALTPTDCPPTGGILDTSGMVWWLALSQPHFSHPVLAPVPEKCSLLDIYDHEFGERLRIARRAIDQQADPTLAPLVTPVRVSECKTCPWFETACLPWLEEHDHVSLLPGQANRERAAVHAARGVRTRRDMSLVDPRTSAYDDVPLNPGLPELVDDARAIVSGHPWRRRTSSSEALRADLKVHAVEIDIDMENGPGGAAYLWGLWVTRPYRGPGGATPEYVAIDDYREMSQQVQVELTRRLAEQIHELRHEAAMAGGTLALYHWSPAEFRPLATLLRAGALNDSTLRRLGVARAGHTVRGTEWIDLERVWKRHVITGTRSSLKSVVRVVNPDFDYEVDKPGGDHSQAHYLQALEDAAAGTDSPSVQWLHTYNRSDVRATADIRHWMRQYLPTLPSIARWSSATLPT